MRNIKLDIELEENYELRIYNRCVEISFYGAPPLSDATRISVRCSIDQNNEPHNLLRCGFDKDFVPQECITYMFDKAAEVALQVFGGRG